MQSILYQVNLSQPEAHLFEICLTLSSPDPAGQVLSLPAWIPGSYMIRDFAKNIVTIAAFCGDAALAMEKLDKQSWRCAPCEGPLRVRYQVFAWDLSVRSAHFDTTHAFFNGSSLFLMARGRQLEPCDVEILAPGANYRHWRVATSLPCQATNEAGFGRYRAENYEDLIDHPVEIGDFTEMSFEAAGVAHSVVITGKHNTDLKRLGQDLSKICEQHISLFGQLPLKRYWFLVMAVGEGYGGLEHKTSTSLLCNRDDLPRLGETSVSEGYRRFLGLCSHEYFHLWNVKRIRPLAFVEGGMDKEVHTRLLWVFEGFTSYYDDLALVRCGCIGAQDYLGLLAQIITRVQRTGGRHKQSVAESSFDAWTKFYKQDENAPNAIVSYYAKGALIALCLDLQLRWRSAGACSLDQVMQALWERYGLLEKGVPEQAVETLINEVSGLDLSEFFAEAVYGVAELPLQEWLQKAGVELRWRPGEGLDDLGGAVETFTEKPAKPVLGVRFQSGSEALVSHVFDGGAAQKAGISPGDVLLALGGIKATANTIAKLLAAVPTGQSTPVHLYRRDELMELTVTPLPAPSDTCELRLSPDADGQTLALRKAWLGQRD